MTRRRSFESLYLATQPLILNLIGLPAMAFVVRSQGVENYGQWQTAMTITGTVGVLSHLGLRPYLVRAVARDPASAEDRLTEQLGLRLALAAAGAALAIGAALVLGHSRLVVLCTAIAALGNLFSAATACFADILEGLERFVAYTNIAFFSGLSLQAASVLVGLAGWGPVALSLAYLMGPAVSAALMGLVLRRAVKVHIGLRPARWKALLHESRAQTRAVVLGGLEDRGEPLLLPKVANYADMGHFAAGSIPAGRLVTLPNGVASYYFPKIARRHAAGVDLRDGVAHLLTLLLLLTLPTTLGIVFLSDWVSALLFPADPARCAQVMRWTAWSLPLAALASGFMCALQATGRIDQTARIELFTIVIGLMVTLICIFQGGVLGAAVSWLLRAGIGMVLLLGLFWRPFRGSLLAVPWIRLGGACVLMQAAFMLSRQLSSVSLSNATILTIGAISGTFVFLGFLVITRVLHPTRVAAMLSGGDDDQNPMQ